MCADMCACGCELAWVYVRNVGVRLLQYRGGAGIMNPRAWAEFIAPVPRGVDILDYYYAGTL